MSHESTIITKRYLAQKLLATNSTATSYAAPSGGSLTRPDAASGAGTTFGCFAPTGSVLNLIAFGAGADNATLNLLVTGYRRVKLPGGAEPDTWAWVPRHLAELVCTLGTAVGVASSTVVDTDRLADTIAASTAGVTGGSNIISPGNNLVASVEINHGGDELVCISGKTNGSATNWNCAHWSN